MVSQDLFYKRMLEYNTDVFPVMILCYICAVFVIGIIGTKSHMKNRISGFFLSFLFIFNGLIEFIFYYGSVSSQYYVWGSLWIIQGIAFFVHSGIKDSFSLEYKKDYKTIIAIILIFSALIIYPVIGFLTGHGYPTGPIFGVAPCPVTIFTFALLIINRQLFPIFLLVIPFLWSLTGIYAIFFFHVYQDGIEVIAGILGLFFILHENKKHITSV